VTLYIPLMKHLGMSWSEIKDTPKHVLQGLLHAYNTHETMHCMDGYTDKQVSEMAKDNPQIRKTYRIYLETKRKYNEMLGLEERATFKGIK
tara:strand:- start:837 stop:1109 length:273 start_codon:yes stop_codon:yes gene_type:complete